MNGNALITKYVNCSNNALIVVNQRDLIEHIAKSVDGDALTVQKGDITVKNPFVTQMLLRLSQIHDKKNDDYAKASPYENFERSALVSSWFTNDQDKAFVVLIATKLARLATLLSSNKEPNNESINDSFDDLAMYCILWATFYQKQISSVASLKSSE